MLSLTYLREHLTAIAETLKTVEQGLDQKFRGQRIEPPTEKDMEDYAKAQLYVLVMQGHAREIPEVMVKFMPDNRYTVAIDTNTLIDKLLDPMGILRTNT